MTIGSTHKPNLRICDDDGDFSIITPGAAAAILCSIGSVLAESLNKWWTESNRPGRKSIGGYHPPRRGAGYPTAVIPVG